MKVELQRRRSLADHLETLLKSKPGEWIPMAELAAVGGIGGWRTRLSELGRRTVDPMHIEHNGLNGARSCHRYVPRSTWPVFEAQDMFTLTPPETR